MEFILLALSIILWALGIIFLLAAIGAVFEGTGTDILFLLIIGIILCNCGRIVFQNKSNFNKERFIEPKTVYFYKVKELEKNTVFNISDSIGGFKPKDTVWVNYKKMMVDPLDSIAMKAVIIEEIK